MGAPIAGLLVVAQDTAIPTAFHSTVTDADGNYTLRRMPTCQAKVWFNADAGYLNYFSEYHNDKGDHGSADAVNVTAGETTSGIDAVLAEQPALSVTTGGLRARRAGRRVQPAPWNSRAAARSIIGASSRGPSPTD